MPCRQELHGPDSSSRSSVARRLKLALATMLLPVAAVAAAGLVTFRLSVSALEDSARRPSRSPTASRSSGTCSFEPTTWAKPPSRRATRQRPSSRSRTRSRRCDGGSRNSCWPAWPRSCSARRSRCSWPGDRADARLPGRGHHRPVVPGPHRPAGPGRRQAVVRAVPAAAGRADPRGGPDAAPRGRAGAPALRDDGHRPARRLTVSRWSTTASATTPETSSCATSRNGWPAAYGRETPSPPRR